MPRAVGGALRIALGLADHQQVSCCHCSQHERCTNAIAALSVASAFVTAAPLQKAGSCADQLAATDLTKLPDCFEVYSFEV